MRRMVLASAAFSPETGAPMLKRLATLVFAFAMMMPLLTQEALAQAGVVHFEDGTTLDFLEIEGCSTSRTVGRDDDFESYFPVYFENTWREIGFDAIESIRVVRYTIWNRRLRPAVVEVRTRTGIAVEYELGRFMYCRFSILDALTGEITPYQVAYMVDPNDHERLHIRSIEIYPSP